MKHCAKATMTMEQARFTKLSLGQRISLSFHLAMCDACRKYKKDSEAIERVLQSLMKPSHAEFTDSEKKNLIQQLNHPH